MNELTISLLSSNEMYLFLKCILGKAEDQITSKNKPGSLTPEPTKKAEPSDTDTVSKDDLKRISDCKSSPVGPDTPRTSARLESRRPVTPSSEQKTSSMRAPTPSKALFRSSDLEDPYDFKEVEEGFSRFEPSKVLEESVIKVEAEEEKKEEKKPGRGRKKKIIPVEVKTEKVDELETKPEVRVQPISCVEPEPAKPIAEIDQAKPFPESEPVLKVGLDPPTSGIPLNTEKPATSARDNSTSDLDPDLLIPKKEAETKFKVEIKEVKRFPCFRNLNPKMYLFCPIIIIIITHRHTPVLNIYAIFLELFFATSIKSFIQCFKYFSFL